MIIITNNENIKTCNDLSCHLELEAKCLEASKATKAARFRCIYMPNNDLCWLREPKSKNHAPRHNPRNGLASKEENVTYPIFSRQL